MNAKQKEAIMSRNVYLSFILMSTQASTLRSMLLWKYILHIKVSEMLKIALRNMADMNHVVTHNTILR